jgi:hypothetical protein
MNDAMALRQYLRRRIQRLGPYQSLFLLAVPLAVVEPFKLATVFIAGSGHWITGAIGMLCAYAVSLFLTHWLFGVVRPKLLELPWFAASWRWLVAVWKTVLAWGRRAFLPRRRVARKRA